MGLCQGMPQAGHAAADKPGKRTQPTVMVVGQTVQEHDLVVMLEDEERDAV